MKHVDTLTGKVFAWHNALTDEYLATFLVLEWLPEEHKHEVLVLDTPDNRRFDVSQVGSTMLIPGSHLQGYGLDNVRRFRRLV